MSTKGSLTREQAISKVGEDAVARVEAENCDFTSRLQTDGDPRVEFSATVKCNEADGFPVHLTAYYYQMPEDLEGLDDLSGLEWEVEGYEVW